MKLNARSGLTHYVQGLLMGGSDIIPGVSGGTMALILGIYERLINAISHFFALVVALFRFNKEAIDQHWQESDLRLLIPLALGIATAVGLASTVILHLIETYPEHTQGLFLGLVLASIPIPWRQINSPGLRDVIVAVLFAGLAFFFVGITGSPTSDPTLVRVFFSAAFAICAMILPGLSGAFLLVAMGMYEVTLQNLRAAAEMNLDALIYVATFVVGMGVGLGSFSQLLRWLLDHRHDATMAALVGLMVGALRALWPYLGDDGVSMRLPGPEQPVLPVLLLAVIGFAFVSLLAWWGERRSTGEEANEAEV